MILRPALSIMLLSLWMEPAMADDTRALALEVSEKSEFVVVTLQANSPRAQTVEYTLEVSGKSTSRHHGKTSLIAGSPTVLSTIRTANDPDWCARLTVTEEGREPYEVTRGAC